MAKKIKQKKGNPTKQKSILKKKNSKKSTHHSSPITNHSSLITKKYLAMLIPVVVTLLLFIPSISNDFTNWDDNQYVYENPFLELSADNFSKFFTESVSGNIHPFTMLSLSIDNSIFGSEAFGFHLMNLFFHLLNVLLVFFLVFRISKKNLFVAFLTALWFGIHPMHVESVAWISARKDVLYAFFFLLALIHYWRFLETKKWLFYALSLVLFVFSCLAKPAAVVFPVLILLFDFFANRKFKAKVLLEKIPFFLIALGFGILTLQIQAQAEAIDETSYNLFEKFIFACYGFSIYIFKLFVPIQLATFIPYPASIPWFFYLFALISLFVLGYGFWGLGFGVKGFNEGKGFGVKGLDEGKGFRFEGLSKKKVLVFGILFYFIIIALVLQFITIGAALISERYTYVPYIGLFFILAYYLWDFLEKKPNLKMAIYGLIGVFSAFWIYQTHHQIKTWENSETLWSNVIEHYPNAKRAYQNRGFYYYDKKDYQKSLMDYNAAYQLDPNNAYTLLNRGNTLYELNQLPEAQADYGKLLSLNPNDSKGNYGMGNTFIKLKKYNEALEYLNKAIQLAPNDHKIYGNRASVYYSTGKFDLALEDYTKVLELAPNNLKATQNRGAVYLQQKNYTNALVDFNKVLEINNQDGQLFYYRSLTYEQMGDKKNALSDAETAIRLGFKIPGQAAYLARLQ